MNEIDLSLYFEPLPYVEAANFYKDNTLRLGRTISKYSVEGHFPDWAGAKVAIIGLNEYRGAEIDGIALPHAKAADEIRKDLYNLYPPQQMPKVADLGNLQSGRSLADTYFALDETVHTLLSHNIIVVLLGGSQDLTYAVYKSYARLHRMMNILSVDARLNLAENLSGEDNLQTVAITHNSYMSRIVVEPDNYLFNYINLGYQTYLVENEAVNLMSKLTFDSCRLGNLRDNIQEAEPYVRDADCLSFDLCSLKRSESPANPWARPTGISAEDACQIFRYAGLTQGMDVVGVFEYYPELDRDALSTNLIAEMVWCFLDALPYRTDDNPASAKNMEFKQYTVPLEESGRDLVFYKCRQTDRWWMELPCDDMQQERFGRHRFMPCSYTDYQAATRGEISARWWNASQRLK